MVSFISFITATSGLWGRLVSLFRLGTVGCLGLAVLLFNCRSVKSVSQTNRNEYYDPNALMHLEHRLRMSPNQGLEVDLLFQHRKLAAGTPVQVLKDRFRFIALAFANYESRKVLALDTIKQIDAVANQHGNGWFLRLPLKKLGLSGATVIDLFVEDKITGRQARYDIPITGIKEGFYDYEVIRYPSGLPLVPAVCKEGDTLIYQKVAAQPLGYVPDDVLTAPLDTQQLQGQLRIFGNPWPAALPPFMIGGPKPKPNPATSLTPMPVGKAFIANQTGLFFLQADSSQKIGVSFYCGPRSFHKLTHASELVAPLIYMTSSEERRRVQSAESAKLALDKFFLELGGTRDNARRFIRNYYEQVEESNQLFTKGYKEGWRTDMGLVYIIFGKPDHVQKRNQLEIWRYETNAYFDQVQFLFETKPTIFQPQNQELIRYSEYERLFYATVELWRKGVVNR